MGFIDQNGKKMSREDLAVCRRLYEEFFEGRKQRLRDSRKYNNSDENYQQMMSLFESHEQSFLAHFDEIKNSPDDSNLEDFYHDELIDLFNDGLEHLNQTEANYRRFMEIFGNEIHKRFGGREELKDSEKGLRISMKNFRLTKKPFRGIEEIAEYDPARDSDEALSLERRANSGTMRAQKAPEEIETLRSEILMADRFSRTWAGRLKGKEKVTSAELYNIFSSINSCLRSNDMQGGCIRYDDIFVMGNEGIRGVIPSAIPMHVNILFGKFSEMMNQIRKTENPSLRKSQAVQLASFAYQLMISEHIFQDGNGRSCRMFADTILQSFGLPPHCPLTGMIGTGKTIGSPLDFEKGAMYMFEGVKTSDELLKLNRQEPLEGIEEQAKRYMTQQRISTGILDRGEMTPEEAINISVQVRQNKFSLEEAMNEMLKQDSWHSSNSPQYEDVVEKINVLKQCLETEPVDSLRTVAAVKKLDDTLAVYDAYCNANPKRGSIRAGRIHASSVIRMSMHYFNNCIEDLTRVQAPGYIAQSKETQNEALEELKKGEHPRRAIAKYITASRIEKGLTSQPLTMTIEEAEKFRNMQPDELARMAESDIMKRTIDTVSKQEGFRNLSPADQLDAFTDRYLGLERKMAAQQNQPELQNQPKAQNPHV